MGFHVHALWVWLLNQNFATRFKGNKRTHTLIFTAVSTFLCDQQKGRFFTQDTVANHTPKKYLYSGWSAVATEHMGKSITHMIYVWMFSFRSALGTGKRHWDRFSSRYFWFPCQYLFINIPYSSLPTCLLLRRTNGRNVETFRQSKHIWVSKGVRRVGYWTKQYFHIEMKAVCRHSHLLTHRLLCPCSAFRPQLPRVHPSGAETTQTALNVRFNSALWHSGSQAGDSIVVSTPCSTDLDTVPWTLFIRNASSNAQYAMSEPSRP
jgi:hypothetical protein